MEAINYRDPDYVQVAIFKDRVEIRNPGTRYGNLTIKDFAPIIAKERAVSQGGRPGPESIHHIITFLFYY